MDFRFSVSFVEHFELWLSDHPSLPCLFIKICIRGNLRCEYQARKLTKKYGNFRYAENER